MKKPELLAPAGSVEAFYAAIEAGADAIYLGLRKFNARERAKNFNFAQLKSILKEAAENNVKIYVTLNTVIKNNELAELFDVLYTLEKLKVDAVIIQDLGLYHLAKQHFPRLELHASTQMGHHNSLGAQLCQKLGIKRVIMARELTYGELVEISKRTRTELELFVHGALCYSFSGMCMFSSYLGGMSANRGNCRQPCRRRYTTDGSEPYLFNLKDNQQLKNIRKMEKLGVASLKIEGRMKSPEYVYQTVDAYRKVIDNPRELKASAELLRYDLGREKTAYFMGGNIKEAINEFPYTGIRVGVVNSVKPAVCISLSAEIKRGDRLRILSADGHDSQAFKVKKMLVNGNEVDNAEAKDLLELPDIEVDCHVDDHVFLVNSSHRKFSRKLKYDSRDYQFKFSKTKKQQIIQNLVYKKPPTHQMLFARINDIAWLRKIYLDKVDKLIIHLDQKQLAAFRLDTAFLKKNAAKFIIQLPRFISEKNIKFYYSQVSRLIQQGIRQFALSHLSQMMLFDNTAKLQLYTTENVYVFNDAAASLLKKQHITNWIYPLENDLPNLLTGNDRRGIIPLLFYPELFFSRMPIDLPDKASFADHTKNYIHHKRDGLTIIVPEHPVSLLQFHKRLTDKGFGRFLIDFSWFKPSSNIFNRIIKEFASSLPEQPATTFNFKMGLK